MAKAYAEHCKWSHQKAEPYVVECDRTLANSLLSNRIRLGVTLTSTGFYGPQCRKLRLTTDATGDIETLASFEYEGRRVTNLEMETSGIYGLSKLLGHRAVSMNCILANRATGTFSENPKKAVNDLIAYCLQKICG